MSMRKMCPWATRGRVFKSLIYIVLCACGVITSPLLLKTIGKVSPISCQVHMWQNSSPEVKANDKAIVLVWLWRSGLTFDFKDCQTHFKIDGCVVTEDRSLYSVANAVIFFHKGIDVHLDNLPKGPRPPFQKWIWFNIESPTNTGRKAGLENLFNLTLTYRRDSGITTRYELSIERNPEKFVLPKKDKSVCWIASNNIAGTGASSRTDYYNELRKHIDVKVYGRAVEGEGFLPYEKYYSTIGSCKFYLAFENSKHKDYITEKLNGPLVAGTVPVVLGTTRENYEQFIPADSFIHVDDFPNPKALANYLHQLDQNDTMYMSYFSWRQYLKATPHLLGASNAFTQPICEACGHISHDNTFNVAHDLFWWYHKTVPGHQW